MHLRHQKLGSRRRIAALVPPPRWPLTAPSTKPSTSTAPSCSPSPPAPATSTSPRLLQRGHIVRPRPRQRLGFGASADDRVKQVVNNPPSIQSGNMSPSAASGLDPQRLHRLRRHPQRHPARSQLRLRRPPPADLAARSRPTPASGSIEASGFSGRVQLETAQATSVLSCRPPTTSRPPPAAAAFTAGAEGALFAETGSGDMEIGGHPASDWKIETGSGSRHLTVAPRTSRSTAAPAPAPSTAIRPSPPRRARAPSHPGDVNARPHRPRRKPAPATSASTNQTLSS